MKKPAAGLKPKKGRMPRLEPGDRVAFDGDAGSPYLVSADGARLRSAKGRRYDQNLSDDLYEERLRWREGWMHVTKKKSLPRKPGAGSPTPRKPGAGSPIVPWSAGDVLVLKKAVGTIPAGRYVAQALHGSEWTLVSEASRVVYFAQSSSLLGAHAAGHLTREDAPRVKEKVERPAAPLLRDESRIVANTCDHRLEMQGDIVWMPFASENGNRINVTWCGRCGALRTSDDEEWRVPGRHREPRRAAVSIVRNDRGLVLSVYNRRYRGWTLPGGLVEEGETVGAAQARELREETGLETVQATWVCEEPHAVEARVDARPGRASVVAVYAVTVRGEPRAAEEGCPVVWLTPEEFLRLSPFREFYQPIFGSMGMAHEVFTDASGNPWADQPGGSS